LLLALPLLAACTSDDTPPPAKPLPAGRASTGDICAELLPASALSALEVAGVRAAGPPTVAVVPLTAPGEPSSVATEGCEVRVDGDLREGAVVRRVLDTEAIAKLRKGIARTTDKLSGAPAGWEVRWSDAASTTFAFRADDSDKVAYVVQLVTVRPKLDRKQVVERVTAAVLRNVAR
jgi:hypothetical protein